MFKKKNQGQSTTEYLLVVGLASFFVLVLAAQMNPRFSALMGNLENVVASKIAGGKLLGHYKVDKMPQGSGTQAESATQASTGSAGEETSQTETQVGTGSGRGEREEPSFLGSETPSSTAVAQGETGASPPSEVSGAPQVVGSEGQVGSSQKPIAQEEQKSKASEKAAEEKAGDSKGKGLIYTEGEEEGIVAKKRFDWMKIVILILIIILVIYVAFEIFKAVKVNKSK